VWVLILGECGRGMKGGDKGSECCDEWRGFLCGVCVCGVDDSMMDCVVCQFECELGLSAN
jgi:hypothetical protein